MSGKRMVDLQAKVDKAEVAMGKAASNLATAKMKGKEAADNYIEATHNYAQYLLGVSYDLNK